MGPRGCHPRGPAAFSGCAVYSVPVICIPVVSVTVSAGHRLEGTQRGLDEEETQRLCKYPEARTWGREGSLARAGTLHLLGGQSHVSCLGRGRLGVEVREPQHYNSSITRQSPQAGCSIHISYVRSYLKLTAICKLEALATLSFQRETGVPPPECPGWAGRSRPPHPPPAPCGPLPTAAPQGLGQR